MKIPERAVKFSNEAQAEIDKYKVDLTPAVAAEFQKCVEGYALTHSSGGRPTLPPASGMAALVGIATGNVRRRAK